MYGKLINFDFNSLTNLDGYSYTHIQNKDNKSNIELIIELRGEIPYISEMIPGIIALRSLLNIKNYHPS